MAAGRFTTTIVEIDFATGIQVTILIPKGGFRYLTIEAVITTMVQVMAAMAIEVIVTTEDVRETGKPLGSVQEACLVSGFIQSLNTSQNGI
jgi:hypothetical protein